MDALKTERDILSAEVKKLHKLCKAKDTRINKMTKEKGGLNVSSEANQELDTQQVELESLREHLEELSKDKQVMGLELQRLKKLYKGRDVKTRKFEEVVTEQEKILVDKDTDVLILRERLHELQELLQDGKYDEDLMRNQLEQEVKVNAGLKEKCRSLQNQVDVLKHEAEIQEGQLNHAMDKMEGDKEVFEETLQRAEFKQTEVEKLQTSVKGQEKTVSELKKLQKIVKGKEAKLRKIEELVTEKNNEIQAKTDEVKQITVQCEEFEQKYNDSLEERDQLLLDLDKFQKLRKSRGVKEKKFAEVVQAQERALADKVTDVVVLQERIKDLSSRIIDIQQDDEDVHQQLEESLSVAVEWEDKCEALQEEINMINDTLVHKNTEIKTLLDKIADANAVVINLQQDLDDSHQRLEQALTVAVDWEDKCEALQHEINILNDTLANKDQVIKALEDKVNTDKADEEDIHQQLANALAVAVEWEDKSEALQEEINAINDILDNKNQEIKTLQDRISLVNVEPDFEDLHQQLEESLTVAVQWEDRCEALQEEINTVNGFLDDKNQEITALQNHIATTTNAVSIEQDEDDLHQQLADSLAAAVQWEDRCEALQEEINTINDTLAGKNQEINALQNHIATTTNAVSMQQDEEDLHQQLADSLTAAVE